MNNKSDRKISKTMQMVVVTGMLLFLCLAGGGSPAVQAQQAQDSGRTNSADEFYVALPSILKNYGPAPAGWTTILSEDFEGAFPGPWNLFTTDGYTWADSNCRPFAGGYSGQPTGGGTNGSATACFSEYPANVETRMTYGPFSLVGATKAELSYQLWLVSEHQYDFLCWAASTNNINYHGNCDSGNSQGWLKRTWDLANVPVLGSLLGESEVWITLKFTSDSSTNLEGGYVDDILLRKCPAGATCP